MGASPQPVLFDGSPAKQWSFRRFSSRFIGQTDGNLRTDLQLRNFLENTGFCYILGYQPMSANFLILR